MKYRRLKSITGDGTIMRYYKFTGEALTNAFYGITDGIAEKIEGEVGEGVQIIGFSHGGNNLAKGLIFLDINPGIVYMGIFEDGEDDRPEIGDVVNGYQRVIDTHYDGDDGVDGKNDEGFGVETLDNPYYLFTIVQPAGTEYASEIDDSGSGEESGGGDRPENPAPLFEKQVTVCITGGTGVIKYTPKDGVEATETVGEGGFFFTDPVADAGDALSTVYDAIAVYKEDGTTEVADLADLIVPAGGIYTVVNVGTVTP